VLRLPGSVGARFAGCVAAMAVLMSLPLLVSRAGELFWLAPALLLAGMATAPTMVTGMTLVQHATPAARLNEGMTLAVTALLGGIAIGSAGGGWAVEHLAGGAASGYAFPALAALLAAVPAAAQLKPRRKSAATGPASAPPEPPPVSTTAKATSRSPR
jgi:predicted MFS family arabinose efflux permease